MTKYPFFFVFIVSLLSVNMVHAQHRSGLGGSYSVSVGYVNMYSASADNYLPTHVSNVFWRGMYVRYSFEYDKILSPFMFVSYNRKYDDSIIPVTPQLWNVMGGVKIRNFHGKKWPFYSMISGGIENAKLRIREDTFLLKTTDKNAVINIELGLEYPVDSFVSGDVAFGFRKPFTSVYKGFSTHWRLGVSFDFSKR
ncbi:MAG: hypothetical protein F4Y00_01770 [Bacteroidetes bacterium SB0662_bin_6]|nr:hypothetical protein [Bacteroidetes bacterium SB0668_bin_1]MYE03692.1 hypothetical protein [Bacteroidetes bacterium SB0662_bin_6]